MVTDYFKITALEPVSLTHHNYMHVQLAYRIDGGSEWHSLDDVNGEVYLDSGQTIEYKGNNYKLGGHGDGFSITSDGLVNISGNLYSLLSDTNFSTITDLSNYDSDTFRQLFYTDADSKVLRVVDASGLELPATTLAEWCYNGMFRSCTSLTTAPELPATTLIDGCYEGMFENCNSLRTAPELPATTVAGSCYYGMFRGCTSLTTAPSILPATTLAEWCYDSMFEGCTSLTTAPVLPATTLAQSCYQYMFENCTSLTTAPELPATTLTPYCYQYMFNNCSNLNYIKCLATDISATSCTSWVNGVASTGTFVKAAGVNWTTGSINGIPSGWTVVDYVPRPTVEAAYVGSAEVNKIYMGSNVIYEKTGPAPIDYSTVPLTIEALSDGNINIRATGTGISGLTIYYSYGGDYWESLTTTTAGTSIPVGVGDKVQLKGDNPRYAKSNPWAYVTCLSGSTCQFKLSGNIMSLVDSVGFETATTLTSAYTFLSLFQGCTGLTDASNLVLPATTLANYCYQQLFAYCSNLVDGPKSIGTSATTMAASACIGMFYGCTSLTGASELPATTLATSCYWSMFDGCTSLTTAPSILPATSAVTKCYQAMFEGCTNLVNPPVLGASIALGSSCAYMFSGCTSLYKAPDLNVPLIVIDIGTGATYYYTFSNCTNLHYIKTTKSYTGGTITQSNFSIGVNTDGVFLKPSNTTWAIGTDGVPTGWTVLNYDEEYQIQLIKNDGADTIVIGDMYGYYGDVIGLEGVDITGEVSLQYNMGQIPFWYNGSVVKSVSLGIIPFGDYEFVFNQDRGLYELIIN